MEIDWIVSEIHTALPVPYSFTGGWSTMDNRRKPVPVSCFGFLRTLPGGKQGQKPLKML